MDDVDIDGLLNNLISDVSGGVMVKSFRFAIVVCHNQTDQSIIYITYHAHR